jgi:ATP-dependent Clp protease ATP-binding subunit ClpC
MQLPGLSTASEKVLTRAVQTSTELGHGFLGVEHIFLSLAADPGPDMNAAVRQQGFDLGSVAEMLRHHVSTTAPRDADDPASLTPRCHSVFRVAAGVAARRGGVSIEPTYILQAILREGRSVPARFLTGLGLDLADLEEALAAPAAASRPSTDATPLLSRFGRDLTALALGGHLGPVVGREGELARIAQTLARRSKNNPVLVGEAGVGKTAVVEGLAQWLLSPDGPAPLRGRRIVELSMAAVVAGTKFRGEFEERLMGILSETASHPEVVLFLDEIHSLVGAGSASGEAMDASNILKPALARGDLRCIGATTIEEYRRFIERDAALERRFDPIMVEEPSPDGTLAILRSLAPVFETHHRVQLPTESLQAAVDLTIRHVPDRRLPDKALDVVDQTCARKRLTSLARGASEVPPERRRVAPEDIAATVAQWTGIPVQNLIGGGEGRWLDLEDNLRKKVFGQDEAVRTVVRAVLTAKAGLATANRPLGVFFFMGPTGVGKTKLAKSLAALLFADERRLLRFDMSEFMEPHSVAKLIGAPPGYVGHEREGVLISAMRTHRHAVVLFDEVEKAHPAVFDLFLQMFDEGRLTGSHGKVADFTQAIVILTSNLSPAPPAPRTRSIGYNKEGEEAPPAAVNRDPRAGLLRWLRPELVNRLDAVVEFRPLSWESLQRIARQYVKEIEDLIAPRGLHLEVEDRAYDLFLRRARQDVFGAREIKRVVDADLRQPLAEHLLSGPLPGETLRVVAEGDGIKILRA